MEWLVSPNPTGVPNSDVLRPYLNGEDITRQNSMTWTVDFDDRTLEQAAQYEEPFRYVESLVRPVRVASNSSNRPDRWWLFGRSRPEFRQATMGSARFLVTPRVAKHRVFVWAQTPLLPDSATTAILAETDLEFGVLQSRAHEVWALRLGTQLETRPRYTPTTSFETFPFPEADSIGEAAIAAAASNLHTLRQAWLNPPEWVWERELAFPARVDGPWKRALTADAPSGIATARYRWVLPLDEECAKKLSKRTLTKLYNERPAWLDLAHKRLDEAVFAAYGWDPGISDDEILEKLLALNLERSAHEVSQAAI
jgi:restriction-modification enzyme MmeI-like protein